MALVAALAMGLAAAAPPEGKGPGSGGGGGGGGKPAAPDLYGDLVLIDRDVYGVPITIEGLGPRDQPVQVPQPIIFGPKVDCPLDFDNVEYMDTLKVVSSSVYSIVGVDAYYIPLDEYGELSDEYAPCTTEADFERLSAARSPENVTDHALMEMVTTLTMPGAVISLDEAGRLQVRYLETDPWTGEEFYVLKTIDAPRENLGGFQRLLEAAELSHPEVQGGNPVTGLPGGNGSANLMARAAAMFGAAGSKSGQVGLDVLIYSTQIMAIPTDMTADAKLAFGTPIEVAGGATYFDFSSFTYDRSLTYAGDVCYLKVESPVGTPPDGTLLPVTVTSQVVREALLPLVFPPLADTGDYVGGLSNEGAHTGFTGENAWGFTQAADDARAVIQWVHDHPVPIELAEYCELGLPEGQNSMRPTE